MRNVLADLALESEAATALAMRLARAFDRRDDAHEAVMARLLTPIAKFWICKRGSHFAQEAMECLGGNGYVEEGGEGVMARIYREMPLNSIWEGAGNIMALDLLRACARARPARRWRRSWRPRAARMRRWTAWSPRCPRASRRWPPRSRRAGSPRTCALAVQAALLRRRTAGGLRRLLRLAPRGQLGPRLRDAGPRHRLRCHHRACHAALSPPRSPMPT